MTAPDLSALDRDLPLVLLPARLETRFGSRTTTTADGQPVEVPVLHVRIYPDDANVDAHDPTLTPDELRDGEAFWAGQAKVVDGEDAATADARRRAHFQTVVEARGVARATYVVQATRAGAQPESREGGAKTPTAALLPDVWVVTGWLDGQRVFVETTKPVRPDLPLGPVATGADGQAGRAPADSAFLVDDPMLLTGDARWLVDLPSAIEAGMAITVDLSTVEDVAAQIRPPVADRVSRLFAVGVRLPADGRTIESEAGALADLLIGHRYSDGAELLGPGTATNNTQAAPSGWTSRPDSRPAYDALLAGPTPLTVSAGALEGEEPDGAAVAAALGVDPAALGVLPGAGMWGQLHARRMNEALFPLTWGELISELLVPTVIDATTDRPLIAGLQDAYAFTRDHWATSVRARGPLPTLRLGRQPYGLLPVTSAQSWAAHADEPSGLVGLQRMLASLRPFWTRANPVGRGPADPGQQLARTLGLAPVPHQGAYWSRPATGDITDHVLSSKRLANLVIDEGGPSGDPADVQWLIDRSRTTVLRAVLPKVPGFAPGSRLAAMHLEDGQLLRIPVAETTSGDNARGPADYLAELAASVWATLILVEAAADPPLDLLYQLVRRSLMLANEQACFHLAGGFAGVLGSSKVYDNFKATTPEIYHADLANAVPVLQVMRTPVAALAGLGQLTAADVPSYSAASGLQDKSFSEIVYDKALLTSAQDEVAIELPWFHQSQLALDTRNAVSDLAEARLSDAEYTRLVGETISLCSTRYDAWVTSLATKRLARQRAARPTGVLLGGYGWLMNLARDDKSIPADQAPQGWADEGLPDAPLVEPSLQVGWVHAPSLAQARTGGILRAGELAHGGEQTSVARLDLTSARVRTGAWLLDGVRQGQTLAALLGYRLERLMHERSEGGPNLHRWVDELRACYPQRSVAPEVDGPPQAQIAPPSVVDGLAVWEKWRTPMRGQAVLNELPAAEAAAVDSILRDIDAAVEAVADLLVAEGVHHLGAGDHVRAGATFAAVAEGTAPPDRLSVVPSPRSGSSVDHRVLLALGTQAGTATGWVGTRPRAKVSPRLDKWLGRLLGPPSSWRFEVVETTDAGEHVTDSGSLTELGDLCALDAITESAVVGGSTLLTLRALAATGHAPITTLPDGSTVAPYLRSPADLDDGQHGWDELLEMAGELRDVLAAARPARPDDVAAPSTVNNPRQDSVIAPPELSLASVAELADGLTGVVNDLDAATSDVEEQLAKTSPTVSTVRIALGVLTTFGIASALLSNNATDEEVVAAGRAAAAAGRGLVSAARKGLAAPDDDQHPPSVQEVLARSAVRLEGLQRVARGLLGEAVVLTPDLDATDDLTQALAGAPDVTPARLDGWLATVARVRPALASLVDARDMAEVMGLDAPSLSVAQPGAADAVWFAGRWDDTPDDNPKGNKLRTRARPTGPCSHVVLLTEHGADTGPVGAGIVLDQFTEMLPAETTTTGLAVQADAPGARPPQSLLLALHPDPANEGRPWSVDMVEEMLVETLDLAALRTVELDDLSSTGIDEYLPAVYVREGLENAPDIFVLITDWILRNPSMWSASTRAANKAGG